MAAKRITPATKEKIKKAANELIDLVEMGEEPQTAAVKIARVYDLTKDQIRMVVRAYNTAASLSQLEDLDKRAEVPRVINAEDVVKAVFSRNTSIKTASQPSYNESAAVSSDWKLPVSSVIRPTTIKTGSASIKLASLDRPKPNRKDVTPFVADQARKEAGIAKLASERRFANAIDALAQYFSCHGSVHPDVVKQNAVAVFGKEGETIVKLALDVANLKHPPIYSNDPIFDAKRPPYSLIKQAVDCCNEYLEAVKAEKLANFASPPKKKLDIADLRRPIYGTIFPELEPERWQTIFPELDFRKEAKSSMFPDVGSISSFGQSVGEIFGKTQPSVVKPKDVSMNIEAASLKVKSYLIYLMANDPVISKYPSDEIVKVYNALSRLAPRAMQQPNLIRMYLRIALQSGGVLDTFHTNSLVSLNRELDRIATGMSSGMFNLAEPERGKEESLV